jgi:hypothetical protein
MELKKKSRKLSFGCQQKRKNCSKPEVARSHNFQADREQTISLHSHPIRTHIHSTAPTLINLSILHNLMLFFCSKNILTVQSNCPFILAKTPSVKQKLSPTTLHNLCRRRAGMITFSASHPPDANPTPLKSSYLIQSLRR